MSSRVWSSIFPTSETHGTVVPGFRACLGSRFWSMWVPALVSGGVSVEVAEKYVADLDSVDSSENIRDVTPYYLTTKDLKILSQHPS